MMDLFNLDDETTGIPRELGPGFSTRIYAGERSMLSVVTAEPGAASAIHSHPEEQWGMVLEGRGVRIQDGVEHPVGKGDFWLTPGGVEHGFVAGPEGARLLDVFAPPRAEYRQGRSGRGEQGGAEHGDQPLDYDRP